MKSIISDNSLFDSIANAIVEDEGGEDYHLPDGFALPPLSDGNLSKFADGAIDGIYVYHTEHTPPSTKAKEMMVRAMKAVGGGEIREAEELFVELGRQARAISIIDEIQEYILGHKETVPAEKAFKFAIHTVFNSKDREAVKFGLIMLELLPVKDDTVKEMIRTVGLSDEFTLFAIFVASQWENANEEIFRLAKKTRGWGRIHAVERLIPDTPAIRDWLLREGTRNTVLPAYSALNCWEGSEAENILFGGSATAGQLADIGRLLGALLDEGPCPGLSAMEKGDEVVAAYLRNLRETDGAEIDKALLGRIRERYAGTDGEMTALVDVVIKEKEISE